MVYSISTIGSGITAPQCRPSGYYYNGTYKRTYVGYLDLTGKVKVVYYDHDTETWSSATELFDWNSKNDHRCPAIIVIKNGMHKGKILVLFGGHDGFMRSRRSTNVEDISAFDSSVELESDKATYPQLVETEDGSIFGFYRKTLSDVPDVGVEYYRKSIDGGSSWGSSVKIIDFGSPARVYSTVCGRGKTIHIASWLVDPNISYPIYRERNVYYMRSLDNGVSWGKLDGTPITLPATRLTSELIWATPENEGSRVCDIKVDPYGNPYILSNRHWGESVQTIQFHRFTGEWTTEPICQSSNIGYYVSGEGAIDPNNYNRVYIPQLLSGKNELCLFKYINGVWTEIERYTIGSTNHNFRPQTVFDPNGVKLIWNRGSYAMYDTYDTTVYALLEPEEAYPPPPPPPTEKKCSDLGKAWGFRRWSVPQNIWK